MLHRQTHRRFVEVSGPELGSVRPGQVRLIPFGQDEPTPAGTGAVIDSLCAALEREYDVESPWRTGGLTWPTAPEVTPNARMARANGTHFILGPRLVA